jgi:thymidylate synthase (FAD)
MIKQGPRAEIVARTQFIKVPDCTTVDYAVDVATSAINHGEQLAKYAGQLCYQSWNGKFTKNCNVDTYLERIKSEGHGSVLEHASYTIQFTGIDRADTHELVRHRAGMAYSQVSQRYVDSPNFVLPVSLRNRDPEDKEVVRWYNWISFTILPEYERRLGTDYEKIPVRDRKLRVESARRCLPNETEAPILVTGNLRAWRHIFEMRCSKYADASIRAVMLEAYYLLRSHEYHVFSDFQVGSDGSLTPKHSKV